MCLPFGAFVLGTLKCVEVRFEEEDGFDRGLRAPWFS